MCKGLGYLARQISKASSSSLTSPGSFPDQNMTLWDIWHRHRIDTPPGFKGETDNRIDTRTALHGRGRAQTLACSHYTLKREGTMEIMMLNKADADGNLRDAEQEKANNQNAHCGNGNDTGDDEREVHQPRLRYVKTKKDVPPLHEVELFYREHCDGTLGAQSQTRIHIEMRWKLFCPSKPQNLYQNDVSIIMNNDDLILLVNSALQIWLWNRPEPFLRILKNLAECQGENFMARSYQAAHVTKKCPGTSGTSGGTSGTSGARSSCSSCSLQHGKSWKNRMFSAQICRALTPRVDEWWV